MSLSTSEIRANLLIFYPQMYSISINKLAKIKEIDPASTLTKENILDKFIDKAKLSHDEDIWLDHYQDGVILLACHYLVESQDSATNSGIVVKNRTGSSENGTETEFLRPSLNNFGKFATTKFGRQWEALKEKVENDNDSGILSVLLV